MKKITALLIMIIPLLLFYALPAGADEKEERKWQDESIYFTMVDRFMNGDFSNDQDADPNDPKAFQGGDLKGVIEKLDYIKDMGFTTIWLTPIMDNGPGGYHGYWIEDFKSVDEHFGTLEDAKRLVEEAHERDMKVIFDFVVNHTGNEHPWLDDPEKENWYHEEKRIMGESQETLENGWLAGLPDLNTENEEVKNYLFDAAEFWIEETGVDGFRLDTVKHVPKSFWADFSNHVKSIDEDFFLLGEVWSENSDYIAGYEEAGIDGFVNYPFYEQASQIFSESGKQSLNPLYNVWERNNDAFSNPHLMGNFLDNHDNKRFTRRAIENDQNPVTRWKLGLTYMFTSPGIPIVYYGSEVPLDGGEDPDNRRMMNFKAGDQDLNQRLDKLNAMRDQYPALTRGAFEQLYDDEGMTVFKRSLDHQTLVVAINNDQSTRTAELESLPNDHQLRGLLHDGLVRSQSDGTYKLSLEREQADVFLLEENQGINWLFISFVLGVMGIFVGAVGYISLKNRRNQL
ncbi:alpha-amylase family glycosyl hydrolase [Thalassobacillus sp. CUG 92003]|uniref:alpha-amylase family glycosyl hydrolase n=1 Tax=Thalassobacillus sp. CUG 92003 TaxID=2736641 RepID=UPI0015E6F0C9|nr:alpha-amylase family glycosyl hydrolase [Thalassobacillus sp. CUG 92003]